MKISKEQRRFIKTKHKTLSIKEIAQQTQLEEKLIKKYLKKQKLKNGKEGFATVALLPVAIKSKRDLFDFVLKNLHIIILLVVVTFGIYFNSLQGAFVSDDISGYVEKYAVTTLTTSAFMGDDIYSGYSIDSYAPVSFSNAISDSLKSLRAQQMVFAVAYYFFQLNPVPMHLMSVFMHIVVVLLVFVLVSMWFNKKTAVIAALLFAVHPVNVEAVAWISGCNYLINAIFVLLVLLLYTLFFRTNNLKYLFISMLVYTIGFVLVRSPWFLITPFLLILVDQMFLSKRIALSRLKLWLPYMLLALLYAAISGYQQFTSRISALETDYGFNLAEATSWFIRAPYTTYMATKLLIFPKNLSLYQEGGSISTNTFIFMVVLVLVLAASIVMLLKSNKPVAGLFLFIFFAILPTYSPVQVAWFMAERYLYVSVIAFCILLALFFISLEINLQIKNLAIFLTVILVLLYSVRTVIRNVDWQTPKNLWESTARVAPESPRVYNNLGDVYAAEGDWERSVEMFSKALELDPFYAEASYNLANTYVHIGNFELARFYYEQAYQFNPQLEQALQKIEQLDQLE